MKCDLPPKIFLRRISKKSLKHLALTVKFLVPPSTENCGCFFSLFLPYCPILYSLPFTLSHISSFSLHPISLISIPFFPPSSPSPPTPPPFSFHLLPPSIPLYSHHIARALTVDLMKILCCPHLTSTPHIQTRHHPIIYHPYRQRKQGKQVARLYNFTQKVILLFFAVQTG